MNRKTWILVAALLVAVLVVPPLRVAALWLAVVAGIPLLLRWPEVTFVLFVTAGVYKEDPRLASLGGVDLTVAMGALCVAGMGWAWVSGRLRAARPPADLWWPAAVLWGLAAGSFLWTMAPAYGEAKALRFLTLTALAFIGPWLLIQHGDALKRMLATWMILAVAMVMDALGTARTDATVFLQAFGSSGYLGLAVTTAQATIIFTFASWWTRHAPWRGPAVVVSLMVVLLGMLASGARSAVVVLGATLGAVLLVRAGPAVASIVRTGRLVPEDSRLVRLGAAGLAGATVLLLTVGELFVTFQSRLARLLSDGLQTEWERLAATSAALDAMATAPWGLGIGGFARYFYLRNSDRGFPHNVFLEVGAELGLAGFLALVALLLAGLWRIGRLIAREEGDTRALGLTLLGLCLFQAAYFQFHGDLNDARVLFTWIGCLFAFDRVTSLSRRGHVVT